MGNDHEVKFHEIKITNYFYEIEITTMTSKFSFFMRSNLSIIFDNLDQEVDTLIMRSKLKKGLLATFNPRIVLVTNKSIMKLKLKKAFLGNFNLMIDLLVTSAIIRWIVFVWIIIRAKD